MTNIQAFMISCVLLLVPLNTRSVRASEYEESSFVYDVNDAPLLRKVLKMLDVVLSIDASPWTTNLTTQELNMKAQLLHTDVTKLGQLLNLSTSVDWIRWDEKYTKAIQYNDKVTNDVSNAEHVGDIVSVIDDLNDVIQVGPGIYAHTTRIELCTKLNMIVKVAGNISQETGGPTGDSWDMLTAQLINEINKILPDPIYSKESYDLIKLVQEDLTDLMDFSSPDWSELSTSSELHEKLQSFATAMNAFSNMTHLTTLNTWEPAVTRFNELAANITQNSSSELVTQLEHAAGSFGGMMNVDVNDWATTNPSSLNKVIVELEHAVVNLDHALNRKKDADWEKDVLALHHELTILSTNTTMTLPHDTMKHKTEFMVPNESHSRHHKSWKSDITSTTREEHPTLRLYIQLTRSHHK